MVDWTLTSAFFSSSNSNEMAIKQIFCFHFKTQNFRSGRLGVENNATILSSWEISGLEVNNKHIRKINLKPTVRKGKK